jgi:hypothetical protein
MSNLTEKANAQESASAFIARNASVTEQANARGYYVIECIGLDGNLKWRDTIENLVTTQGKNDALDKYLSGSSYTATWFLGFIDLTGYTAIAAGDTAASHSGWTESVAYSNATRPATAWSAAASGSKTLSANASFSINATATIKGAFLISNSTKSGTTGVLYSAGLFSGGDRAVANGDTLNVGYTASL